MSSRAKKVNIWDISTLFMGAASIVAVVLLVAAQALQQPVMKFFAEIVLLTFVPVVAIYIWTEKMVEWMHIDSRILDLMALFIRVIAVAMFILFAGSRIVDMVKDIPNAVSANYSCVKGVPVRTVSYSGLDSRKYMAVNGIRFTVDKKTLTNINQSANYSVTYLPHSKYVIDISQESRAVTKKEHQEAFVLDPMKIVSVMK